MIVDLNKNFQQVEYFHWCGMGEEFSYIVEKILQRYPHYAHEKTEKGENGALIATYINNLEALKVINKYAPESLNLNSPYGNILMLCLDYKLDDIWNYLVEMESQNKLINVFNNDFNHEGLNLTQKVCLLGDSDKLDQLMELGKADFHTLDITHKRTPLFFTIDNYHIHQDNYLFEICLQQYKKAQLLLKDIDSCNVWEHLKKVMEKNPIETEKRIYSPLELSLKDVMFS
jgi:hypothetical protein